MNASKMKSIQMELLDYFNDMGVSLKNIEFEIDSNYHEIECGNKTAFYIIDKYFPYIAICGFKNDEGFEGDEDLEGNEGDEDLEGNEGLEGLEGNEGGEYNICRSLALHKMSAEYKQYYKDAKERVISLFMRVKSRDIDVSWGNTEICDDEYEVNHEWPVKNPYFSLDNLLTNIEDAIRKFVDIDANMASIITLWIAFTWTLGNYKTSPLLIIKNDDDHYDSKIALLRLIMQLTKNAVRASAFGTRFFLDEYKYNEHTVIFDDSSAIKSRELLNLLINSRTRSDATKFLKNKDYIGWFDTFGAKALVCEGDIPKSLMQSGITIDLGVQHICSRPSQITESDQNSLVNICYELEYFALHYNDLLGKAKPESPDYLSNSERENWEPMFEIAMIAGDTWFNKAVQSAQAMSSTLHQDMIIRQQLLNDAYNVVKARKSDKISTKTLISRLSSFTDKPWATYDRGANITSVQLAKLLNKFNIKSKNMRISSKKGGNNSVKKGYEKNQIVEAFHVCRLTEANLQFAIVSGNNLA